MVLHSLNDVTFFKSFQIDSPDVATGLLNITGTSNYSGEELFLANRFITLQIMYVICDIVPHIIHCLQHNAKITEYYFEMFHLLQCHVVTFFKSFQIDSPDVDTGLLSIIIIIIIINHHHHFI